MTPVQIAALFAAAAETSVVEVQTAEWLSTQGLIRELGGVLHLTDRGRAFVDHVCALPLPEQVTLWQIPGTAVDHRRDEIIQITGPSTLDLVRINPSSIDEGTPPPPAPPAKRINGVRIPEDPQEKRLLGIRMMENGMGVGEVAEAMGVTFDEADRWFTG